MVCPICGRSGDHCHTCHFVHDHMDLLDGTRATNNLLRYYPAPWAVNPAVRRELLEAAVNYTVDYG